MKVQSVDAVGYAVVKGGDRCCRSATDNVRRFGSASLRGGAGVLISVSDHLLGSPLGRDF